MTFISKVAKIDYENNKRRTNENKIKNHNWETTQRNKKEI